MDDLTKLLDRKVKALNCRPPPFAATAPRPAQLLAGHPMFAGIPDAEFHSQARTLAEIQHAASVSMPCSPWQQTLAGITDTCRHSAWTLCKTPDPEPPCRCCGARGCAYPTRT